MSETFLDGRVEVVVGDLTTDPSDAIVNAANSTLLGGGGVDGAIHRAGGEAILDACKKMREREYPAGLPTGKAVITTAGMMPSMFVIHTVGPIYGQNEGHDAELLADCYTNSLELAKSYGLGSIAFPSISTGAYHYPKDEAAEVVSSALNTFFAAVDTEISVRLVFFNAVDARMFVTHQRLQKAKV